MTLEKRTSWITGIYKNFFGAIGFIGLISCFIALVKYNSWSKPWDEALTAGLVMGFSIYLLSLFLHMKWKIAVFLWIPILFLFMSIFLPSSISSTSSRPVHCKFENHTEEQIIVKIGWLGRVNKKIIRLKENAQETFSICRRERVQPEIFPFVVYNESGVVIQKNWIVLQPNEIPKIISIYISKNGIQEIRE